MNIPSAGESSNSAANSFQTTRLFWIGMSLVYTAAYFKLAALSGHYLLQCFVFASFPVVQAILIPALVVRREFSSRAQAVIWSAAAAVAFAGIVDDIYSLTNGFFRGVHSTWDEWLLQPLYVSTVLILAGLAGGTALGLLRWSSLHAHAHQTKPQISNSRWSLYLHSALLWIATEAVIFWLISWGSRPAGPDATEVLFSVAGLILIAPIPALSPPGAGSNRWTLVFKYSAFVALVIGLCFVLLVVIVVASSRPNGGLVWAGFPFTLVFLWVLFFPWVALCSWTIPLPTLPPGSQRVETSQGLAPPMEWGIVGLAALCLVGGLPVGLRATAPASLWPRGIGCGNPSSSEPAEYWFWKGYKGVLSEELDGDPIVFRLPVEQSFCVTVPAGKLYDHESIQQGYRLAARTWFWLIDPEQWENQRTSRNGLAHLIGHDFSSYEELSSWWESNGEYLTWSAEDQLLEVHKTDWQVQHPGAGLSYPLRLSVVERLRQEGPKWLYSSDPQLNNPLGTFGIAILDREARLRGLKLFVADRIDVLTGKRQRRIHEYLGTLAGGDFSTEDQWRRALDPNRIGKNDPRYETWEQASNMINELCIVDRGQYHCPAGTLATMKDLTRKTFDSPEQWAQWWRENRQHLVLSQDGRTLVTIK